jgi:acetylornithine deacetylase/succinyl-diaminopimelate desuccinylase-like protein
MQLIGRICLAGVWIGAGSFLLGQPLSSRHDVKKALDYARDHHEQNVEKQIAIAQIPSSPFAEEQRGRYMADEFRRLNLTNVEIDPKGNVLGWRRGRSAHAIVIAAHLDTVFPPGTDFTVKRDGARLKGPGIVDDSRGLAAILGWWKR